MTLFQEVTADSTHTKESGDEKKTRAEIERHLNVMVVV